MSQFVIVPEAKDSSGFLELARTPKTQGRLFRKHILSEGPLHHGGSVYQIDSSYMESVVKNFKDKKCDIVQVPIVDDNNKHSEDPLRNIGEVVDLTIEDGKLYSYIDVRKHADDVGKTLIGASAMFSTNYVDTDTNERVGPTLLHVAMTNRPHVLNLEDFEEVIKLSSSSTDEVILLSEESEIVSENTDPEENITMDLETILSTLKEEHGIDVSALQTEVSSLGEAKEALQVEVDALKASENENADLAVSLSNAIKEAFGEAKILELSNGESQAEALIGVVAEAGERISTQADEIVSLSGRVEGLESARKHDAATAVVEELIRAGKVLPANKDAMIELRLSNEELFDKIVPDAPVIDLSAPAGEDDTFESSRDLVTDEVKRLIEETN